jgi:glycosyltransferase involved in cell wall biosynthesis
MRIGLIARADHTGLAIQTHNFFANMHPAVTLVVDFSRYGHPHPDMAMYPGATRWEALVHPGPDPNVYGQAWPDPVVDQFLDQVDAVFTCETPYNYYVFEEARRRGIKTVLQPNFEFFEQAAEPDLFPEPDVFALPSTWHMDDIRAALPGREIIYLPVPVDRSVLPTGRHDTLTTILHTAGTVAQPNRNGTAALIQAMGYLERLPIRADIFAQRATIDQPLPSNVRLHIGTMEHYWEFYTPEYDMMVLPRRWGGLCLPMQEALACGMPVLMPDCEPNTTLLPEEMLTPAETFEQLQTRHLIDLYDVDPVVLSNQIKRFHQEPGLMTDASEWAATWGEQHSWEALSEDYCRILQ